jgi:DNA modification methylase
MQIEYKIPADLKPRASNPRSHSARQIRQIATSVEKFGFVSPILVDARNGIIAGHGRLAAAKLLRMADVPTVCVGHLTQAQIRAYVIADNKIAENAGWNRTLLTLELKELEAELDFDITVTGFEVAEIDIMLGEIDELRADEGDRVPELDRSLLPVSRAGDVWRIGDHRIICGNALDPKIYERLLGTKRAQLIFIDPPYNVPIAGHVSGKGKFKHGEFEMASGEMSQAEFTKFLASTFGHLSMFSSNGSIHFVCMDWRHMQEVLDAAEGVYSELKNLCVWAKTNSGMGSLYRSQHELVFTYKNGTKPHINNVELGRFGRNRTNLWTYAGVNSFSKDRDAALAMHPTVKPLALVVDAILDCSQRGAIVLDAFAGSGTTLIAAEKTGRKGYGIELDPHYVDTIIRRFEEVYSLTAVLDGTKLSYEKIKENRQARSTEHGSQKTK